MNDKTIELTADIVAAYVSNNSVTAGDIPSIIRATYSALSGADKAAEPVAEALEKPTAGQIRKSITPAALISFIDGRPYIMLKRHLSKHDLTAKSYIERFGLPADYPMTAPAYSATRSALALSAGLGRKAAPVPAPAPSPVNAAKAPKPKAGPGASVPKAKVGRPRKAIAPKDETFT